MNDVDKILDLCKQIDQLEQQVANLQRYHLQTMLMLCVMAGGEIRVSEFDHRRTKGKSLATFTDPANGDRVFVAKSAIVENVTSDN